jgi:hypothetical protein
LYGDRLNTTGSEDISTTPAWEFYDLEADPQENKNLYNDPRYASLISRMKQSLINLREKVEDTDSSTPKMLEIMKDFND